MKNYILLRYIAISVLGAWGVYNLIVGETKAAKILIMMALIGLSFSVFMQMMQSSKK